jgi:hypothetical protein
MAAADLRWQLALLRYLNPAGAHESGLIGEGRVFLAKVEHIPPITVPGGLRGQCRVMRQLPRVVHANHTRPYDVPARRPFVSAVSLDFVLFNC